MLDVDRLQLAHDLFGHRRCRIHDLHRISDQSTDAVAQKWIVGTAQHNIVGSCGQQGIDIAGQQLARCRAVQLQSLDTFHQSGTGLQHHLDSGTLAILGTQPRDIVRGQSLAGGQHRNHTTAGIERRRLDGRLHRHHRQRTTLTQHAHRHRGHGIASHHDYRCPGLQQVIGDEPGPLFDEVAAAIAIGCMGRIGHIEQILLRQGVADFPQHRQPTDTGIENTNKRAGRRRHSRAEYRSSKAQTCQATRWRRHASL